MDFTSTIREVKAKTDAKGTPFVEMKLDAISCGQIDLEEAKGLVGKAVRVRIDRRQGSLPGLEN